MNTTGAALLSTAALAVAALWSRGHETAVAPPPPVPDVERVIRTALDATVTLNGDGDPVTPDFDVHVTRWPVAAKVFVWSMPYSVMCEGGARAYDTGALEIVSEVRRDQLLFALEGYVGMAHGIVVGADEADARSLVTYYARGVRRGLRDVGGVLYATEGPPTECDPGH